MFEQDDLDKTGDVATRHDGDQHHQSRQSETRRRDRLWPLHDLHGGLVVGSLGCNDFVHGRLPQRDSIENVERRRHIGPDQPETDRGQRQQSRVEQAADLRDDLSQIQPEVGPGPAREEERRVTVCAGMLTRPRDGLQFLGLQHGHAPPFEGQPPLNRSAQQNQPHRQPDTRLKPPCQLQGRVEVAAPAENQQPDWNRHR